MRTDRTNILMPEIQAKLKAKDRDFTARSFNGLNLSHMDFSNCNFTGSAINSCRLQHSKFSNAIFNMALLNSCECEYGYFARSNFFDARLYKTDFAFCDFFNTGFMRADLSTSTFTDARFCSNSFTEARLNWHSHKLISSIIYQRSHGDIGVQQLAGFVNFRTDLCWKNFYDMRLNFHLLAITYTLQLLWKYACDNPVSVPNDLRHIFRKTGFNVDQMETEKPDWPEPLGERPAFISTVPSPWNVFTVSASGMNASPEAPELPDGE